MCCANGRAVLVQDANGTLIFREIQLIYKISLNFESFSTGAATGPAWNVLHLVVLREHQDLEFT